MSEDYLNGSNKDRRSKRDRRSAPRFERSDEKKFLHGKVRFLHPSEIADSLSEGTGDLVPNRITWKESTDRRSGSERRSDRDRRCGFDSRSEIEKALQGERRSGLDRRSKGGYRSFKKARAFVRAIRLNSVHEWRHYTRQGTKPDDIPRAPHHIYANDGWAGWGDWLGTS